MRALPAAIQGLARALASPRMLLWLWAVQLAVALPAAVVVGGAIHESLGASRTADELLAGLDLGWLGEFRSGARGLAATLSPTVVGGAALFDNLEAWWSGRLFVEQPEVVAFGALFALAWLLMLGGVLERLARPAAAFALRDFLAAGGRWCFPFARLALVTGVLYYVIFRGARWLFPWIEDRLRDVTVEKTAFVYHLLGALAVVAALCLVRAISDFAKAALVLERRRSALLAAAAGLLFACRHPLRVAGLYLFYGALTAALLALWAVAGPGAGGATWPAVITAFLAAQAMLLARLLLRIGLLGSEVALYDPSARR